MVSPVSSELSDLRVLCVGDTPAQVLASLAAASAVVSRGELSAAAGHDAVLLLAPDVAALADLVRRADLSQAAFDSALVVLALQPNAQAETDLLRRGVEALVDSAASLTRALRHAVERKRLERAARTAFGLPTAAAISA